MTPATGQIIYEVKNYLHLTKRVDTGDVFQQKVSSSKSDSQIIDIQKKMISSKSNSQIIAK